MVQFCASLPCREGQQVSGKSCGGKGRASRDEGKEGGRECVGPRKELKEGAREGGPVCAIILE